MLTAIKTIVEHPEFQELNIGERRLTRWGSGWCIQHKHGGCDSFQTLEEAVEWLLHAR